MTRYKSEKKEYEEKINQLINQQQRIIDYLITNTKDSCALKRIKFYNKKLRKNLLPAD